MGRGARRQAGSCGPDASEERRGDYPPDDVPQSEHTHLVPISWDEFFKEFDNRKLALIYDPDSMFSKIVGRDSIAESNPRMRH